MNRNEFDPAQVPFRHADGSPLSADLEGLISRVIGAAIAVHRALGPGYLEAVYESALAIELAEARIACDRQKAFDIRYRGQTVGEGRIDFLIESVLVVELKSVETMKPLFTAQTISYLRAVNCRAALLLNFNVPLLRDGINRIIL